MDNEKEMEICLLDEAEKVKLTIVELVREQHKLYVSTNDRYNLLLDIAKIVTGKTENEILNGEM